MWILSAILAFSVSLSENALFWTVLANNHQITLFCLTLYILFILKLQVTSRSFYNDLLEVGNTVASSDFRLRPMYLQAYA